jgi:3-O-methylgallate 3,4-dioxygenase
MAEMILGIGTSHSPMLALPGRLWAQYASNDRQNPELVSPESGLVVSYEELAHEAPPEIRRRMLTLDAFTEQAERCQCALDVLAAHLQEAAPDVTIIVSDDQDEWFYDANMPMISVYWGDSVPLIPHEPWGDGELSRLVAAGYGDVAMDVPVAADFGRHLIEYLRDHDFDVSQSDHVEEAYNGRVARRYPTRDGELDLVYEFDPRPQGLPHGYAFIVKRLFDNKPRAILPVIQNTCYPPNQITLRRCYQLGRAIHDAVAAWDGCQKVAVVASGGLSHFVVDEDLDTRLIAALERKDTAALLDLPRHRLLSGTSESLNWVTVGAALEETDLHFQLVDYVPVYRTEAGTGGGWCFGCWR